MNEERRKKLSTVLGLLNQAHSLIEEARDDEQDSWDHLPESMQQGEKGDKMQEAINSLGEALDNLESATGNIDTACE